AAWPGPCPCRASRRTSRGWGPAVRGEQSGRPSRRTSRGWGPAVRGEQPEACAGKTGARTSITSSRGLSSLRLVAGDDPPNAAPSSRGRRALLDAAWVTAALTLALGLFWLRQLQIAGLAGLSSFPLDDPWIHLQFARNLAEGHGFAYNPGVPVAGSTAPLWTLLLAAGARVAGASLVMVKTLGVAGALAAALVLRRAALAWGASAPAALVAAVALVWSGPFAWGALSGMEVTLAAVLVAAALLALARDHLVLTAVAGGLATLARPEAVVLLPFLALARRPTPRRLALFAAIVVAALLPFVAFCWATTGTPFPSTAAAKVEGGLLGRLIGLR